MRIGFTGAHRTGKTTLAVRTGDLLNLPVVTSSASALAKEVGFDFNADNGISWRLMFQTIVRDDMASSWGKHEAFVADRTPLDLAAYLLADVQMTTGDSEIQDQIVQYVEGCIAATRKLFDLVILVPPAVPVEPVDGKPPVNPAYQEHHHFLVRGLLNDQELGVRAQELRRDTIGIDMRLDFVERAARAAAFHLPLVRGA